MIAAAVLISNSSMSWATLLTLMQSDDDFGRATVNDFARGRASTWPLSELDEAQLGELWMWLNAGWSMETDTPADGFVSDDHEVRRWRDDVLRELTTRRTPAALSSLAALVDAYPSDGFLRTSLHDAETRQRDESWHGPTLHELMAVIADARRTVVHDDDALYRLVLSVLDRFATRLQHIGQLLWNETRPADGSATIVWRPKYEPDISALLKDHLEQEFSDRLIVNREVLVQQTTSKGHGLSVDVLVTAGPDVDTPTPLPQCPIEVKGSWNPGLLTDLEAQLVGDYLPALKTSRGVYLCAWFPTGDWSDTADGRRSRASARDRTTITEQLNDAATRASTGGVQVAAVVVDVARPIPSVRR